MPSLTRIVRQAITEATGCSVCGSSALVWTAYDRKGRTYAACAAHKPQLQTRAAYIAARDFVALIQQPLQTLDPSVFAAHDYAKRFDAYAQSVKEDLDTDTNRNYNSNIMTEVAGLERI
jgi:hypothetical protein